MDTTPRDNSRVKNRSGIHDATNLRKSQASDRQIGFFESILRCSSPDSALASRALSRTARHHGSACNNRNLDNDNLSHVSAN